MIVLKVVRGSGSLMFERIPPQFYLIQAEQDPEKTTKFFQDGGHVEVWEDGVRFLEEDFTSLESLRTSMTAWQVESFHQTEFFETYGDERLNAPCLNFLTIEDLYQIFLLRFQEEIYMVDVDSGFTIGYLEANVCESNPKEASNE